ncbi:phage/plasmid replication domain-containing protein [Arsenophonus nasoniae]|uniref:Phage/plasmid replication protein n=1 Tax=Arsenophonus nasoniae TaxID=638 RepID=A0AA95GPQ3_9GAMM|nr:phage/plasmid replication protein [Arsenophonus nasoniae]WGM01627.1 phage/plasmid replication protein [Arsenophonus nasoniae]WGM03048.1 phage/plasmid replication protein [Arsenophonus nasoniae]
MQYDWLKAEQDFIFPLPMLGDVAYQRIRIDTGEAFELTQPNFCHEGSFCDLVNIRIRGSVLIMSGNPSRWGKLDNVFGCQSVDECFDVFNGILCSLGLPPFSKGTRFKLRQSPEGTVAGHVWNGALIKEIHINQNIAVGYDNERAFIRGMSTLRFRNSIPRLHTNGMTCDWLSKLGNAHLIYPSVYCKAHDLLIHSMKKIENKFGNESQEYKYLKMLYEYLVLEGIVRFELKLHGKYLQRYKLCYWGYSEFDELKTLLNKFIALPEKLSVTNMDIKTVANELIEKGIVDSTRAANTTAFYAYSWTLGERFDLNKKQVQVHRARLRKIGIDIADEYNVSLFPGVVVRNVREIKPYIVEKPNWYRERNHLMLVA